jgi:hypothetical protein
MDNSPNNQSFISGIYNHCDRWCERCQFTDRCRLFATQQERGYHDDMGIEETLQVVSESFAEAKQMLIEKADEMGIDLDSIDEEEFAEIRKREKAFVESDPLSHLGEKYWRSAKAILDDPNSAIANAANDDYLIADAFSVLCYFLFFIPVNIKNSIHALLDDDGFEDKAVVSDVESYANGSAKSALLAIDRSLLAWRQIVGTVGIDRARPCITLLEQVRDGLEERFPLARDFVRPGFDEVETVM